MKLATLGLATALAFTGTMRARAVNAVGGSATAWCGNERHDDRISHGRNDHGQRDGRHRRSNSAGSAAAGANSGLNPSGSTLINPSPSGSTLAPATRRAG